MLAVNVTLLEFAAQRRAAAPLLVDATAALSVDISRPHYAQQQTNRTLWLQMHNGTDRQMHDNFIDPALHTMRAVSVILAGCSANTDPLH